jgi:hypothetical protein
MPAEPERDVFIFGQIDEGLFALRADMQSVRLSNNAESAEPFWVNISCKFRNYLVRVVILGGNYPVMLMDWMKMDIQLYPIHLHPPKIHFHPPNISWIST